MHGFLVLRTVNGILIASGDLLQVGRGGDLESRMVFRFKDGSVFDETVVFTSSGSLPCRATAWCSAGPYSPRTRDLAAGSLRKVLRENQVHKDGREEAIDGTFDCPPTFTMAWSSPSRRTSPRGQRDRPPHSLHAQASAHRTGAGTGGEHQVLVGELTRPRSITCSGPSSGSGSSSSPRCSGARRRTTTPGSSLTRCQRS